jgi:hypothetical protein
MNREVRRVLRERAQNDPRRRQPAPTAIRRAQENSRKRCVNAGDVLSRPPELWYRPRRFGERRLFLAEVKARCAFHRASKHRPLEAPRAGRSLEGPTWGRPSPLGVIGVFDDDEGLRLRPFCRASLTVP